jgi:hypothetical protein
VRGSLPDEPPDEVDVEPPELEPPDVLPRGAPLSPSRLGGRV